MVHSAGRVNALVIMGALGEISNNQLPMTTIRA
jgi:hypothetical protein